MKRTSTILTALALLWFAPLAHAAPTLIQGVQINRAWPIRTANGLFGLKILGSGSSLPTFLSTNASSVDTHKTFPSGAEESSGSLLVTAGPGLVTLYVDASSREVGVRVLNPKTELEVLGTISGSALQVSRAFSGAGLSDCDTSSTSKLLWDASSGRFSCGTDQSGSSNFGTGNVITTGDSRYVNTSGDTMTGNLVLQGKNLTATGVYATTTLSSSGKLSVDGLAFLNGNTVVTGTLGATGQVSGSGNLSIEGTASLQSTLGVTGAATLSSTLNVTGQISGTGTLSIDGLAFLNNNTLITGTLNTTGQASASGNLSVEGAASLQSTLGVTAAATLSSTLAVASNATIRGILSGASLHVSDVAFLRGTLNASGAIRTDSNLTLNDDADSNNVILTFGSDTTSETLTWLNTADKFQFSDDVDVKGTASGSVVHAQDQLQSSGTLTVDGAASLQSTLGVTGNVTVDTATFFIDTSLNKVGVGKITPRTEVEVLGAISGSTLYLSRALSGAGLVDCDTAGSSKLLWDASTGRFSCGTDQTVAGGFGTGNVITTGDTRYVNTSGDTMTGNLVLQGKNLTATGVYATTTLSSSGKLSVDGLVFLNNNTVITGTLNTTGNVTFDTNTLFVDASANKVAIGKLTPRSELEVLGAISGTTLYVSRALSGAGLVDCDSAGTSKLLYDSSTGRFSCGSDQTGGGGGYTFVSKSADYTASADDHVLVDASGATITVTLPASPAANDKIKIQVEDVEYPHKVVIAGNGKNILDGPYSSGSLNLFGGSGDTIALKYDGNKYQIDEDFRKKMKCSMFAGSAVSLTQNNDVKITFTGEYFDDGGICDFSTNERVNIKRSGTYRITGMVTRAQGADKTLLCLIWVNGAEVRRDYGFIPVSSNNTAECFYEIPLNKNDYVEMYANNNDTTGDSHTSPLVYPILTVEEM